MFGLSLVYFALVQCFPRFINYVLMPVSMVILIFAINLIFSFHASSSEANMKVATGILMIIVGVLILLSIYKNCVSIRMLSVVLKAATDVFSWRRRIFFYGLLYFLFIVLLIGIILFEFIGFWSNGRQIFVPA